MYLVKKIFMGADEAALTFVSQLCIEEAIGERICEQRPGIWEMQRKACEDILDQEYETMPSAADKLGYLRVNLLRRRIDRGENADASNKTITNITKKEQKDRSRIAPTSIFYNLSFCSLIENISTENISHKGHTFGFLCFIFIMSDLRFYIFIATNICTYINRNMKIIFIFIF